jgi:hypothetical protein
VSAARRAAFASTLTLFAALACAPSRDADSPQAARDSSQTHDPSASTPNDPGARPFPPVDEAARVPDFAAFRTRLRAAIAARDTAALLAAIDPKIRTSFGDSDVGSGGFRAQWRLDDPASPLWGELERTLALGGSFASGDSAFVAPYVFSRWPNDLDSFENVAVVTSGAPALAEPRAIANPLARLGPQILARGPYAEPSPASRGFTRVRLGDGRLAWLANADVRSPVDYRAFFARRGDGWRITIFVAGD